MYRSCTVSFLNCFFVIFKLDSYFLFKLKGYFLYFTPYVHSMPNFRIHFRLVLIIYWFISLHTCCCLARIFRCSLLLHLRSVPMNYVEVCGWFQQVQHKHEIPSNPLCIVLFFLQISILYHFWLFRFPL
jgi:hypothetical protein